MRKDLLRDTVASARYMRWQERPSTFVMTRFHGKAMPRQNNTDNNIIISSSISSHHAGRQVSVTGHDAYLLSSTSSLLSLFLAAVLDVGISSCRSSNSKTASTPFPSTF